MDDRKRDRKKTRGLSPGPGQDHLYVGFEPSDDAPDPALVEVLELTLWAAARGRGQALLSHVEGILEELQPVERRGAEVLLDELRQIVAEWDATGTACGA